MSETRQRRTRNQRKREARQTAFMVAAMLILWVMCFGMFCKALDHPAEQPVNGYAYLEMIGGDIYGHPQN